MEVLWTAVSFAIFASGIVIAGYIVFKWLAPPRH